MAEKVTEVAKKKEKKHRQTKGNSQLRKQGSRLWRMAQKYTMLEVQCSFFHLEPYYLLVLVHCRSMVQASKNFKLFSADQLHGCVDFLILWRKRGRTKIHTTPPQFHLKEIISIIVEKFITRNVQPRIDFFMFNWLVLQLLIKCIFAITVSNNG